MAHTQLEDITAEALSLTRRWTDEIKRMMDLGVEDLSMHDKAVLSGLLAKLMRAATGLIKEGRALAKDARTAASQMTYDDKRKLIVEFIALMPPEHQAELRAELGWGHLA